MMMITKYACRFFLLLPLWGGCTNNTKPNLNENIGLLPEAGTVYKAGEAVAVKVNLNGAPKPDSIVYLLDNVRLSTEMDTLGIQAETANLTMGSKLITARLFSGGRSQDLNTNVVLYPENAPARFGYQVIRTYPHDTASYTQGLEFHQGSLYESSGKYGSSNLRKVDLETGKVLLQTNLRADQFAEGITVVGNKIIQLTWREGIGLVYELADLKLSGNFPYQGSQEGWGLCYDGNRVIKSDGTNKLWFLNKETFREEGGIAVFDDKGQVDQLNELEYIDGKIYANVYQKDKIVIINPQNGAVTASIDMSGLLSEKDHFTNTDVLNGIARDAQTNRLFVTGKKWDKMFEIKLIPR